MMPPTSIDGTDITGATIDGQDVEEITVDGQTVFSAESLPVAYSNLVAWFPFDSAHYGGNAEDDATGGDAASGDSTSFDGATVSSVTFQSSGGATDINTGDASPYADFTSNTSQIEISGNTLTSFAPSNDFSYCVWVKYSNILNNNYRSIFGEKDYTGLYHWRSGLGRGPGFNVAGNQYEYGSNLSNNEWFHIVGTYEASTDDVKIYVDKTENHSSISPIGPSQSADVYIGWNEKSDFSADFEMDDLRVYNKALTQSEVNQIFDNTKPSSKP